MSNIQGISAYQFGLLCHTAQATAPIFLLPKPTMKDAASQRYKLLDRSQQLSHLVHLGLMEDVSNEFKESISEQVAKTGRKYKVYGLSQVGYLLFKDCETRSIN